MLSFHFIINFPVEFQAAILFAVPWSIGAVVDVDGRTLFDAFFRDLYQGKIEDFPIPKVVSKLEVPFPENQSIYDFWYEVRNCFLSSVLAITASELLQPFVKRSEIKNSPYGKTPNCTPFSSGSQS